MWLNPNNPNTFPQGLIDALSAHDTSNLALIANDAGESVQSRLRKQMQADSLQPIHDDEELTANKKSLIPAEDQYGPEILEEATHFLRLQVWSFYCTKPYLFIYFSLRLKTDFTWCSLISGTNMHTVSGVVSGTKVKKKCKANVLGQRKTTMIDHKFLASQPG